METNNKRVSKHKDAVYSEEPINSDTTNKSKMKLNIPDFVVKFMDSIKRIGRRIVRNLVAILLVFSLGFGSGVCLCVIGPWQRDPTSTDPIVIEADDAIVGDEFIVTIDYIKELVAPASELVTTKYYYTDANSYENFKDFLGHKVPLTTDKVVFTYEGVISVGFELDEIKYDIDQDSKTITITLPDVRVLHCEIDEDSFKYPFISDSIFNNTDMTDYVALIGELENKKKQAAENNPEIIIEAENRAKETLNSILTIADEVKEYEIIFK